MARVKKQKQHLSHLTFREAEKEIARLPALILPLGGCEPYGERGCLGAASACVEALASAFSEKLQLLCAPALAFGCSTPYGAFGGTAGVKPRTLTNILCETIRQWYRQGFRIMVIVDSLYDNSEAVDLAVRRLKGACPAMNVIYFSLQRNEQVRAFIGQHFRKKEPGRTVSGILSLAAFIDRALVREGADVCSQKEMGDAESSANWRKRGVDPDQYRRLFPDASDGIGGGCGVDADFGRALFGYILQLLTDAVTPFLPSHHLLTR